MAKKYIKRGNINEPLRTELNENIRCGVIQSVKATFDATGGKAIGVHNLTDAFGNAAKIPANAILTRALYFVETTFTDGSTDAATIKLGTGDDDDEFVAAIAIAGDGSVWDAGIRGTLVGSTAMRTVAGDTRILDAAAKAASMVQIGTSEVALTATVGTAALTAGKLHLFVEYVQYK